MAHKTRKLLALITIGALLLPTMPVQAQEDADGDYIWWHDPKLVSSLVSNIVLIGGLLYKIGSTYINHVHQHWSPEYAGRIRGCCCVLFGCKSPKPNAPQYCTSCNKELRTELEEIIMEGSSNEAMLSRPKLPDSEDER